MAISSWVVIVRSFLLICTINCCLLCNWNVVMIDPSLYHERLFIPILRNFWRLIVISESALLCVISQIFVTPISRSQSLLAGRTGTGVANLVIFTLFFLEIAWIFVYLQETFLGGVTLTIRHRRCNASNLCCRFSLLNPSLFFHNLLLFLLSFFGHAGRLCEGFFNFSRIFCFLAPLYRRLRIA